MHYFDHISAFIQSDSNTYLYLLNIKEHLNSSIESIHKILLKCVTYISYTITIIVFYFNALLQSFCNLFTKKIENHLYEIESNINIIIKSLNHSFETIKTQTESIISTITSDISSLDTNYKSLNKFDNYKSRYEIAVQKQGHSHSDLVFINNLFEISKRYKNKLKSGYPIISKDLKELKPKLDSIKKNVEETIKLIKDGGSKSIEIIKITLQIEIIQYLKIFINRFKGYITSFRNLNQINDDIRTIYYFRRRNATKLDTGFCEAVDSLRYINIRQRQIETLILTMNTQIKYIIPELQLLKSLLQYRDSINIKLLPIKSVTFNKYNVSEFIKNSQTIIKTLGDIPKTIENSINEFNKIFNEIKTKDSYKEHHPEHLTSPSRIDITNLRTFVNNALQEIPVIKFITYYLQIIKLSSIPLNVFKNKINKITNIDTGIKILTEIIDYLRLFYYIHYNSIKIVILFNFISYPVDYVNKFIHNLKVIYSYSEILIFTTRCYITIFYVIQVVTNELNKVRQEIEKLKSDSEEIKKLTDHTSNIKNYLESINSSITSLKSVSGAINVKTLKNNISIIKYHINQVYQNILRVYINVNEIIKIKFKLIEINDEIIKIQKSINDMIKGLLLLINYLNACIIIILFIGKNYIISNEKKLVFTIHSISIFKLIENLVKILDYLSGISKAIDDMKIKEFIENIESQKTSTQKLVNRIESGLKSVESSVSELECAIEGVARNFIKCTLISTIINSTDTAINDNNINKRVFNL